MPKLSVIVAVYNAHEHLAQSLDSLLAQTLADIEIICVDDCSTDDSLQLLTAYAQRDRRVTVVHQDRNTGQGHARNNGLRHATGEYIAFCDSDDWLSPDCLELAARTLDSHPATGCVLLHVKKFHEGSGLLDDYPMRPFEVMTGRQAFELSLDWSIHGWYVARRELYDEDPWDETCHSYSDDNTTHLHYFKSREVRCCAGVYYYRLSDSSVTHRISLHRFDWMRAAESMKGHLARLGVEERIMRKWENIRMLILVDCYKAYHCHRNELPARERRHIVSEIQRSWAGIDCGRLDSPLVRKFGYRHLPSWWFFRLEEWLYFSIRGLLGRNGGL